MNIPEQFKAEKFMLAMIWVALIGAGLILAIDYQIKNAILQESRKAWERIHAIEKGTGRPDHSGNSSRAKPGRVRPVHDSGVEVEATDPEAPAAPASQKTASNGAARDRTGRFQAKNKPVESR